jgi:hypothetical protein
MKTTTTLLRTFVLCLAMISAITPSVAEEYFSGIFCPPDQWVDCDDEIWDLSIYGNAYYKDYSGSHDAGSPHVQYHLNSCNSGYITRTWSVWIYSQPYSCTQTIHVGGGGGFNPNSIIWPPKVVNLEGCDPETDPYLLPNGIPEWDDAGCSMLGRSYRDSYYTISGTCNKIIRKWTVMDWCTYDPWKNPHKGIYYYYQTIKISVDDIPEIVCPDDIIVDSYNCKNALVEADPFYVDPSSCGAGFTITNNSPYAYSKGADISGVYPIGETWVTYYIKYGCGLTDKCKIKVVVKDGKAPTPYCYAYMAVPLMGIDTNEDGINDEGMVEIWAKDLDAGSYAHCTSGPLKFSFSEDTSEKAKTFTCDDLGKNEVEMWVTDAGGNQSWCLVIIDVQNNGANIQPCERLVEEEVEEEEETIDTSLMFTLEGLIMSTHGELVAGAQLSLTDMDGEMEISTRMDTTYVSNLDTVIFDDGSMLIRQVEETLVQEITDTTYHYQSAIKATDASGFYAFPDMVRSSGSYKIQASMEDGKYADINLQDVEVIFRHLIGEIPFTHAYQYIAADVDGDGTVSFADMRFMIELYTSRIEELPIGTPQVMVDANAEFSNPADAISEDCPDFIMVNEVQGDHNDLNFVMIKLGDLAEDVEDARIADNFRNAQIAENLNTSSNADLMLKYAKFLDGQLETQVEVFPNPMSDVARMMILTENEGATSVQVFQLDGKLVKSENVNLTKGKNQVTINVQDLNPGIYMYRLAVGQQMHTGKMIKK